MTKLQRWDSRDPATGTQNYLGADMSAYFIAPVAQNRESDCLSRSNFEIASRQLLPLGAEVARFGHWACGWYELILIHESNAPALEAAEAMAKALEAYPVLDEDHFRQLEWDEAMVCWETLSAEDKKEYCDEAGCTLPEDGSFPRDDNGLLFDILTN